MGNMDHLVVLMLENRSFDSMLGALALANPLIRGLTGNESNQDTANIPAPVWNSGGSLVIPSPDPGELWEDMNMQIFGTRTVASPAPSPAPMSGFVRNYEAQTEHPPYPGAQVMHYYTPSQVPVLTTLATQFALSDCWHASAPCQTWPNRLFAHTGTAHGRENNDPASVPFPMRTVFDQLDAAGIDNGWKIYYHDIPQALTLKSLWGKLNRLRYFEEFLSDAAQGTLPHYSFIEPRYFQDLRMPNDQHPPHNVLLGEQLIAQVYNALRTGPLWERTLLLITYDEHGGCYDHVAPPAAIPPDPAPTTPFAFDRYGVRVPAVFVSPWIEPGTILRPAGEVPFDHASIPKTLGGKYGFAPLTARVAAAPDFSGVLSLPAPTNNPAPIEPPVFVPGPTDVALAQRVPPNGLQRSLLHMAHQLPVETSTSAIEAHVADLHAAPDALFHQAAQVEADIHANFYGAVASARSLMATMFASTANGPTHGQEEIAP